ncbi:MAG: ergothioneine biosynthesis protein EgtB, partial [Gammaproteobacteria bacterium]|nr:ergothioneine biosynthesis protein EgtB [Gammaproteobacteria bacterium]
LTDVKYSWSMNPLFPCYVKISPTNNDAPPAMTWTQHSAGLFDIGADESSFHYDNETPRHQSYLGGFGLASRLVTNSEYLEFMHDGGYENSALWLSDAWQWLRQNSIRSPLYWRENEGQWMNYTLSGMQPLQMNEPVCHVSYYEADAFARWMGLRLPSEQEWEVLARQQKIEGNFQESKRYHPCAAQHSQLFGDCWEWTQSAYSAYPGYRPAAGAIGEYNGKFMCNQMVLRGGSCVTPQSHIRASYRNFFYPKDRWQFSGIRLARDL